jgi:RNA polymerase sigma-70 factor (ECF subfamily)
MTPPKTSASLLIRIRDCEDREAWEQFSCIYRPAIIRFAKQKGLQNADAEDLAQQVLLSVSKSIRGWEPDSNRASFRTWLLRVSHNAVVNALTRRNPDRASGNTQVLQLLNQSPASDESELLTIEVRREVFRFAAGEIESEFHSDTWQAFWLTAIEQIPIEVVSEQLGKNAGSVYAARSRVMRRLKEKVQELQLTEMDLS